MDRGPGAVGRNRQSSSGVRQPWNDSSRSGVGQLSRGGARTDGRSRGTRARGDGDAGMAKFIAWRDLDGASAPMRPPTAVKGSLVCVPGKVCATVAINRLVKTTSTDSRRLYGEADTDLGPVREPCAAVAQFEGASDRRGTHSGHGAARRPWRNNTCELRELTHLPQPQPRTAFKSVLSHGRTHSRKEPVGALWPRAELMVCGQWKGMRITPVHGKGEFAR